MEKREIINLFQNFKQETEELGKIILPIIEKYNLPPKEIIEVCQIGKFIYKLNENLQIIDKPSPPRPDFILQNNLQLIGLEHTRIFTENSEKYNRIKSLFEYSEKIFNQLFPNEKVEKPDFIEEIRLMKHSSVSFTFNEKNWQGSYLTNERLNEEVKKKEPKLQIYKNGENEIHEYWLVLLIGSLSSVSYQLDEMENYQTESDFDRVYLMADFDAKIIRVK